MGKYMPDANTIIDTDTGGIFRLYAPSEFRDYEITYAADELTTFVLFSSASKEIAESAWLRIRVVEKPEMLYQLNRGGE